MFSLFPNIDVSRTMECFSGSDYWAMSFHIKRIAMITVELLWDGGSTLGTIIDWYLTSINQSCWASRWASLVIFMFNINWAPYCYFMSVGFYIRKATDISFFEKHTLLHSLENVKLERITITNRTFVTINLTASTLSSSLQIIENGHCSAYWQCK